jgi:hypothetical protein
MACFSNESQFFITTEWANLDINKSSAISGLCKPSDALVDWALNWYSSRADLYDVDVEIMEGRREGRGGLAGGAEPLADPTQYPLGTWWGAVKKKPSLLT